MSKFFYIYCSYLFTHVYLLTETQFKRMFLISEICNTCRGKCHCVLIGDAVQTLSDYLCLNWVLRPVVGLRFVDVRRVEGQELFIILNNVLLV